MRDSGIHDGDARPDPGSSPAHNTVRFVGIWGVDEQRAVLAAVAEAEAHLSGRCDWRCQCERRDGRYDYRIELTTTAQVIRAQSLEEACRQLRRWGPKDAV